MTSNLKSLSVPHADIVRPSNSYRVAIVGAGTLKGKELAEVLNERNFPSLDVKLLDDESPGKLETMRDEITFIQNVRAEQFNHIDFTFFASDPDSALANWKAARKAGSDIIDLSYALENEAGAVVRSPWIERQLGSPFIPELLPVPAVVAHPAAIVLALIVLRLSNAVPVRHVSATVLQPASELGQKGMDELHEQTVNLLSFQQLPTALFDVQVAFNTVARFGPQSASPISAVHDRILKHYRLIAGQHAILPSLLLLQAPTFHGHTFAIHIESTDIVDIAAVSKSLNGDHLTILQSSDEAPNNVNVAGQSNILASIVSDENDPKSFWLWVASDNLRIAASNAVECAEAMTAARPIGKIQ